MIKSAYTDALYEDNYPDGMERHYWNLARNRVIESAVRQYSEKSALLLDVGCGRGIVIQHLRAQGFNAYGCEVGAAPVFPELREKIFTRAGIQDIPSSLKTQIETVLMLDVLEHLEHPEKVIEEARKELPHLKRIIVTVPSRQELWSNYDDHYGHFRRYAKKDLRKLAELTGFALREARYFFHLLYLPAWISARLFKGRATRMAGPKTLWPHQFLSKALLLDEAVFPGSLPGTSLLGVFETQGNLDRCGDIS